MKLRDGSRLKALAAYMASIGLRMPHSRPDKFLTGPFFFPTTITTGAISFDFQIGTNLTDPGLAQEFAGSPTGTFGNAPNLILHIERLTLILVDNGTNIQNTGMAELIRKTYLATTIKSQNRSYTLGRNFSTIGDNVSTTQGASDRLSMPNELRALSRPIQVDLRSDQCKILTQSAVTGPPPTTNVLIQLEGAAWDPNQFDGSTMYDNSWNETVSPNGLANLKARLAGASHFKGLQPGR